VKNVFYILPGDPSSTSLANALAYKVSVRDPIFEQIGFEKILSFSLIKVPEDSAQTSASPVAKSSAGDTTRSHNDGSTTASIIIQVVVAFIVIVLFAVAAFFAYRFYRKNRINNALGKPREEKKSFVLY
jgi:hypothetical protein